MIPCSNDFIHALHLPNKEFHIKLELYDSNGNYINEISKQVTKDDIGSISIDRSRPIRRSFSFSLYNKDGQYSWGENSNIWLDKRVKVYTGLKLRNGSVEFIPQGVFLLTEMSDNHTRESKTVSFSGQDKMMLFTDKRGKFINEMTIQTGVNVATAIKLITQDVGETLFNFDTVTETVPYELTYAGTDNRYTAMEELAKFAKCEIFYDTNGYLRLKKVEDLNQLQNESSVWKFEVGDLFYAGNLRKLDDQQMYNQFVSVGGGSQTQTVRHILTVTEQTPVFAGSPYSIEKLGRITYFHNDGNPDPLLVTQNDCIYRNKYECMQKLGYVERVSVSIAPLYILDVNDIVEIYDSANNVEGRYMIEKFDIPLIPDITSMEVAKERKIIENWSFI